jgi:hypothetical protein
MVYDQAHASRSNLHEFPGKNHEPAVKTTRKLAENHELEHK